MPESEDEMTKKDKESRNGGGDSVGGQTAAWPEKDVHNMTRKEAVLYQKLVKEGSSWSADTVRAQGRENIFKAMRAGTWLTMVSRRQVFVRVVNAEEFEAECSGLSDEDMGEYLMHVTLRLITELITYHRGAAFFDNPGISIYAMDLSCPPLSEIREALQRSLDGDAGTTTGEV
jgi:hypothetical protein